MHETELNKIAKLIRYYILASSTQAGSGHPTSSLSAVELMTALMFGGVFRFDVDRPEHPNNDRLIFSKGHASPLFYSLWAAAGKVSEQELLTYRKFGSVFEGHPTPRFKYTEAATGSLGQGLSIGVGMALNAKYLDKLPYRTYVLLGDSEMAEGSMWEAIQLAAHYKLDNLVGVLDVNRLGQRGQTMYGFDLKAYEQRVSAFGWQTVVVSNGHSFKPILDAYAKAMRVKGKPTMIIAKTIKGKGVSFLENKDGWHGKALKPDQYAKAMKELGAIDTSVRGEIAKPKATRVTSLSVNQLISKKSTQAPVYKIGEMVATRKAYGNALARLSPKYPNVMALDGEVSNSTFAEIFRDVFPKRFFEMYIAEQNMSGAALGLSRRGKIPFVSTFAAFLTRAFDQIRMSQYSQANSKFVGSHAGVSIGEDGPSQMGLEDLAMFRTILNGVVLYPSDAVSTEKLVEAMIRHLGICYLRTTRMETPVLYSSSEQFPIGGSKVLRHSQADRATVIAAGVTLHEALAAYDQLKKAGIIVRVIDLYCIKPLDEQTILQAGRDTKAIITVEDHYAAGGVGEAVRMAIGDIPVRFQALAVRKTPRSGKPQELLAYEEIDRNAIIKTVKEII